MGAVLKKIDPAWREFERSTHVGPIKTRAHYDQMVEVLDALIEEVNGRRSHPLAGLLYIIGEFVRDYDERHFPVKDISAIDMLVSLMEAHKLRQADLPEIGAQSVVSAVLSGKRMLNARQIARLSQRFGLPADVFLDKGIP
ncbi:MAG: transcriptional regulator [Gammaproteobacteria bacterium]|nr:transcriptional regulator [Gammaproteobacteria bacterium]